MTATWHGELVGANRECTGAAIEEKEITAKICSKARSGQAVEATRPESTTGATSETSVEHLSQKAEDVTFSGREVSGADSFAASVHRAADEIGRELPRVNKLIHDGAEHINRASR